MTSQPDLFARIFPPPKNGGKNPDAPRYPSAPGSKAPGTSRDAAHRIAGHAATVRWAVLRIFIDEYPCGLTSDEAADRVGESILTVRPRVTELKAMGLVELTADRRTNDSGHAAAVLRATESALNLNEVA